MWDIGNNANSKFTCIIKLEQMHSRLLACFESREMSTFPPPA